MRQAWIVLAGSAAFAACVVPIEDVESQDDGGAGSDASASGGSSGAGGSAGSTGATGGLPGSGATSNAGAAGSATGGAGGGVDSSAGDSQLEGCQPFSVSTDACTSVTTGDANCDTCMHQTCCTELSECMKDETCAEAVGCYLKHCFGQPATQCMIQNCQPCVLSAFSQFTPLSTCLLDGCGGPSGKCPEFQD